MTQTFLPPPADLRCAAVIYRTGWNWIGSRCPQRHQAGSDLCKRHAEMQAKGQHVQRVLPPQKVGA
ncbi:MAG: hypothetical protein ACM33U_08610 [Solirubrobacterales bacterium]